MINQFKWVICLGIAALLGACSTPNLERTGSAVDVYPITHKYALSVEIDRLDEAKKHAKAFIDQHRREVLTNDIQLNYYSERGRGLADYTMSYLHSIGVLPKRITLQSLGGRENFDFELVLQDFQVRVPDCSRAKVGEYFLEDNGCFTENMRWISIENPEKVLNTTPNSSSMQGRK